MLLPVVATLLPLGAQAALVISGGSIELEPDTPDQAFPIQVFNSGSPLPVRGLQLNIEIGDSASQMAPVIADVELLSGTVFETDNTGQGGGMDTSSRFEVSVLENPRAPIPELPSGDSLAATIVFDTTGLFSGSWRLEFTTPAGPTAYLGESGRPEDALLVPGSVTIRENQPAPWQPAPRLVWSEGTRYFEMTVPEAVSIEASAELSTDSWRILDGAEFIRIGPTTVRIPVDAPFHFFRLGLNDSRGH